MFEELGKNTYAISEGMDFAKLTANAIEGENIRYFRMKVNETRTFLKADFIEILGIDGEVIISQPYWVNRVSEVFDDWHVLKNTEYNKQNNTFELIENKLYALSSKYIFLDGNHIGYLLIGKEVNASLLDQWAFSINTELALIVGDEKKHSTLRDGKKVIFLSKKNKKDDLVQYGGTTYSFSEFEIANSEKEYIGTIQVTTSLKKLFESLKVISKSIIYYVVPLALICLLLVFLISKGLISLSSSLKRALLIIEHQKKDLELKVVQRTKELSETQRGISAILKSVPTGVVVIEKNGKIGLEYSRETEKIFESSEIASQDFSKLLIDVSNLSEDEKQRSQQIINTCLGEPNLTFEINKGSLPNEFLINIAGKDKFIQINWSFTIDEHQNIDKILACINDVTEFKTLEQESLNQREKLKIFNSIMSLDAEKYSTYSESMVGLLASLHEINNDENILSKNNLESALRYLHTIKGNSRTYGFTGVCDITHRFESGINENKSEISIDWFCRKMEELEARWKKITDMASGIQNFSSGIMSRKGSLVMSNQEIDNLLVEIEICQQSSKPNLNRIAKKIKHLRASSFADTIAPCVKEFNALSKDHSKNMPELCIKDQKVLIKNEYQILFQDIFGHLFRNSYSHGFLESEPSLFRIDLDIQIDGGGFHVFYQDSGFGLNLQKLRQRAQKLDNISNKQMESPQFLANLIWESGVSTKEQVDDVAGRGIGMNAVKHFIEEIQGYAAVNILQDSSSNPDYVKFKLDLYFPKHLTL
ncbi:MAG: Hpt domain-containing protein [Oligoflexales bacterium]